MVRDHVTLLKYEKGDFFDWHQDYEKFVMNKRQLYIEGHLLFCISAPESGGELELGYDGEKYSYVQNGAVLFDKLKRHRACKVDAGTKILMAIDVMYKHRDDPMGGDLDAIKDTHGPAFLFDYRNVALYVNQHPEEFVPFGVMMYTNTSEYYERYDGDGNCLIYIYDSSGLRYSEWMTYEDGKFSEEATICEYDGKDHASFNFVEDIGEDVLNKSEDMLPMAFDSKLVLDKAQITMIILEIKHYLRKDRCGNIRYIVEDTCNEPPEEYWNAEFFHGCGYFREGETLEPKVYE
jgi:hypothetical protein